MAQNPSLRLRIRTFIQAILNDVLVVAHPVVDYIARLWRFVGPRLTDRGFAAGASLNIAFLFGFADDPDRLNLLTLGLWIGANFFFPTWDNLPNERLAPPNSPQQSPTGGYVNNAALS